MKPVSETRWFEIEFKPRTSISNELSHLWASPASSAAGAHMDEARLRKPASLSSGSALAAATRRAQVQQQYMRMNMLQRKVRERKVRV